MHKMTDDEHRDFLAVMKQFTNEKRTFTVRDVKLAMTHKVSIDVVDSQINLYYSKGNFPVGYLCQVVQAPNSLLERWGPRGPHHVSFKVYFWNKEAVKANNEFFKGERK